MALEDDVRRACDEFGEPPRIILTGKTGAGKSSLVNALLGRDVQATDVVPCTMDAATLDWRAGDADIKLVDVPGFGEPDKHAERVGFMLDLLPETHLALLVVGAPDRALDYEKDFLRRVRERERLFPVLVVGSRIDLLPPRGWEPARLDLAAPRTPKERNIKRWAAEVARATETPERRLCLVASGEHYDDRGAQYGLEALQAAIFEHLPEAAKNHAARAFKVDALKTERAHKVIMAAAVAAAVASLVPVPFGTTPLITTIQVGMVVQIGLIYGASFHWRKALGLLGPAAAFFLGPLAFHELVKLLPIVGSVTAAGVAGTITVAIGLTFVHFFMNGRFQPTPEEIREQLRVEHEKARGWTERIVEEVRRRRKE